MRKLRPFEAGDPRYVATLAENIEVIKGVGRQELVDFHSQISNGAFNLCMAEKNLNSSKVACSPIDQRGLGSPQRMCAIQ